MNAKPKMLYRRFGRTELAMPVFSCGGMRYQQCWKDAPSDEILPEQQKKLEACIQRAMECGINHIETARGYGSSEMQLGRILPKLPRDKMIVQTKIGPHENVKEFLNAFETSYSYLQLDYIDLLGIHGVNTLDLLEKTLKGGTLEAARQLQKEGRVRHIGFSTHAPLPVILDAINTGEFSYVNLHWYYVDQQNEPAIEAATKQDMGVFIISPNDKGGMLYNPPEKLKHLCHPFTPMGFNDLFCLGDPRVHTLSLGVAKPEDIDAHLEILPFVEDATQAIAAPLQRLEQEAEKILGKSWMEEWNTRLPFPEDIPQSIPIYQILRLFNLAEAFDMTDYAKMRYNLLGNGGHWFPGEKADERTDWNALRQCIANHPQANRVIEVLQKAHAMFNADDVKRLSTSDD